MTYTASIRHPSVPSEVVDMSSRVGRKWISGPLGLLLMLGLILMVEEKPISTSELSLKSFLGKTALPGSGKFMLCWQMS